MSVRSQTKAYHSDHSRKEGTGSRTEFTIREGTYHNVRQLERSKPSRQALYGKDLTYVKVSFVSCKDKDGACEWIVFNTGKELYVYPYEGVGKTADLEQFADRRVYKKPTIPVCHDFNQMTRSRKHLDLVVGFSTGPLQLLSPLERQAVCSFNEDGSIDNTKVTCLKWVPGSEHTFVSSHQSGCLYVWDSESRSRTTGPQVYIPVTKIQDAVIETVKPKSKSPILFRWTIGHGSINAFAFSPDSIHIAIASEDGFMRVYDFHKQVIYSRMRSYFGGLLCVCWSPDGKYTATGGEDDLITVWSFEHRKVVARGEGHKSYVNEVAFDPYTTILPEQDDSVKIDVELTASPTLQSQRASVLGRSLTELGGTEREVTAYRLGSVGQDTQLCLWDLSGDALKIRKPFLRSRSRVASKYAHQQQSEANGPTQAKLTATQEESIGETLRDNSIKDAVLITNHHEHNPHSSITSVDSQTGKPKKEGKKKKNKDEGFKLTKDIPGLKKVLQFVGVASPTHTGSNTRCQVFETCNSDDIAPKMDEVNLIEPLVAKKISPERLTCLVFREDCIVTANQEGFVQTWARPGTDLPTESPEPKISTPTPANPGINSPKPGSGSGHNSTPKTTTI